MMKIGGYIGCLFFLVTMVQDRLLAQSQNIQTLEEQIKSAEPAIKLQAWHLLTDYYYNRAIARAQRRNEAAVQWLTTDTSSSLAAAKSLIWSDKAKIHTALGEYEDAIAMSIKAIQVAHQKDKNNTIALATAYSGLGCIYSLKGHHQLAIEYLLQAIKVSESTKNRELQLQTYHQAGKAYLNLYDTEQALYFLNKAKKIETSVDAALLLDLGRAYLQQADVTLAAPLIEKGIEWSKKQGLKRLLADGNWLLGELAYTNLDWEAADNAYYTALKQYRKIKDKLGEVQALKGQAKVKLQQNEPKKAIALLQQALQVLSSTTARTPLQHLYSDLANAYRWQEDYQQALEYYQKYTIIKDSILDRDKVRAIVEIQTKHNAKVLKKEKKELEEKTKNQALQLELRNKEINIQQLRNNQNFYIILALGVGLGLAVVIAFLLLRQNGLKSQIRESELEQRALRSQMNPHFMFNSLNSIQSLIAIGDNSAASIYLAKFSRLVRRILQNTRQTYIPMQQEIDFLDNYIELEQRRFKEAFDFEVDVTQIEDAHFVLIPPLVIQPFIENAIIHGLLRKKEKGKLRVIFEDYNQDFVKCVVKDNGIGRAAAAKYKSEKKHESLGIKITEQRLAYLTMKQKPDAPLIQVVDLKDEAGEAAGTAVEILLPIKYKA